MKERQKVVLLGFDACDIDIVRALARDGKLPTFRRLLQEWSGAKVQNPFGFFVGSTWTSFFTARTAATLGYHCWDTITVNYERRLTCPSEIRGRRFWDVLGDAGRKVAVLDVPHSRADAEQPVLEISEYGCHDRHFGLRSSRQHVRDEIVSRFGFHPILTIDPFAERHFAADDYVHRAGGFRTAEEEGAFQRDLLAGLQRKRDLSRWIYQQDDWDLFLSVFGESHAVGHQAWYLHDPNHPKHDALLAKQLGDSLEKVYAGLDCALGEHLALIGKEVTALVLLSHGMQAHYDGTYTLEPALTRLDTFYRSGLRGNALGKLVKGGWQRVGDGGRKLLAKPLAAGLRQVQRASPSPAYAEMDIWPSGRAPQRFYMSPNNSVYGGVRINLQGREAAGLVAPGKEFDAVCERLRSDLLELINVDNGCPVIRAVERTDAHYKRAATDELPDLLIDWNHDALVETVWSPKIGMIHAPYTHWRTGDHRPGGFLFAKGPGIASAADLGTIDNRNLGPTISAMLGIELRDVDGAPAPALLQRSH
jgi:predicted AlkP superfamily phosphohydrolase/phosphomutase